MSEQKTIVEILNEAGVSKHVGGLKATLRVGNLCRLDENKRVLDVGSGIGITPSVLAKEYGCRVIGIDILPRMIDLGSRRAKKKGVADKVEFKLVDAHQMPFEDNYFDAAISEDAILIMDDKPGLLKECVRVTKPGGYVGLNCTIWMETPPQKMKEEADVYTELYDPGVWPKMLENAGLVDVVAEVNRVTVWSEIVQQFKWFGFPDFFLQFGKMVTASRPYVKKTSYTLKDAARYMGYGTFVGKKP
jgi:ubiquinone/menaquinone biosynthesis C-methylase UbiE